jgi:hypothetical protein
MVSHLLPDDLKSSSKSARLVIKEEYAASDPCSVGMHFRPSVPFFNDGNPRGASFVFCLVLAAVPLDARCEI